MSIVASIPYELFLLSFGISCLLAEGGAEANGCLLVLAVFLSLDSCTFFSKIETLVLLVLAGT